MSRLSIFSFSTLEIDLRKVLPPLLVTLVLFFAVDRVLQVLDPVKLYGGWENPYVQMQVDGARRWKKKHGRIDVMLLGSSIGTHIDVGRWQEATGDKVVCYNAAMGGQHPEWARFIFENVYYPDIKPARIVYVLCPRDINGPAFIKPEYRYNAPLFKSVNARRFLASSLSERAVSSLESVSYLFRARRHMRRYIQQGSIPQDPIYPLYETGVNPPTVRHLKTEGPATEVERKALVRNHYASFLAPEDGELGELLKLAAFCKARQVEFVVVNQPVAPAVRGLYDNADRDYQAYLSALDKVRKAGFRVVDMAAAVPLKNRDFSDFDHPNRWGASRMVDYMYREIIRPWYSREALVPSLPDAVEIDFYDVVSRTDRFFYPQDRSRIPPSTVYASPLQMVTDRPSGRIALRSPIPPGTYVLDLYGADERTTRTARVPGHRLAYEITPENGRPDEIPFEMSRQMVQGETLSRLEMQLKTASTLALVVEKLEGTECVLDSLFIRRKVLTSHDDEPLSASVKDFGTSDPMLVRNASFEFGDPRLLGYPAEWLPYTGTAAPWGTVKLVPESHDGNLAVELTFDPSSKGWGCVLLQPLSLPALKQMLGHEVTFSVWAKCPNTQAVASIRMLGQEPKEIPFSGYSTPGQWQLLSVKSLVPDECKGITILVGGSSPEPTLFDDVAIEIGP
jgi:hypothetical protein